VRVRNTGAVTNGNTFRPNWNLIGFTNHTFLLEPGEYSRFDIVLDGPNEADVYVENLFATTTTLTGAGDPPASTLRDGLVAYWNLDETSGASTADQVGSADLVEAGGAWNKNFIHTVASLTPGWTNIATSRVLSNDSSGLELGRSGESFSFALVFAAAALGGNLMGEYAEPSQIGWRLAVASSRFRLRISSNGSAVTELAWGSDAVINTQYLVVGVLNQDENLLKLSVNGGTFVSTGFSGDIHDSTAPFMLGGVVISGAYGSSRGVYDQPALWNRALSQSEVEELWDAGAILNLDTLP
jgi:hypothetical protein